MEENFGDAFFGNEAIQDDRFPMVQQEEDSLHRNPVKIPNNRNLNIRPER